MPKANKVFPFPVASLTPVEMDVVNDTQPNSFVTRNCCVGSSNSLCFLMQHESKFLCETRTKKWSEFPKKEQQQHQQQFCIFLRVSQPQSPGPGPGPWGDSVRRIGKSTNFNCILMMCGHFLCVYGLGPSPAVTGC